MVRVVSMHEPESVFGGPMYRRGQIGYVMGVCDASDEYCSGNYDVHVSFTSWDDDSICMQDSDLELVTVVSGPATIEWGVFHRSDLETAHRGPWTREKAESWIAECLEDGFVPGTFLSGTRVVSGWKVEHASNRVDSTFKVELSGGVDE